MKRILNIETTKYIGQKVKLAGWVHKRRDHGRVIFIDLRDRSGLVQVVFRPEQKELYQLADSLRAEWVISLTGEVKERPKGMENKNIPTGQVEIIAEELEILNQAKTPPFEIADYKPGPNSVSELGPGKEIGEEIRLKYRYLDLRRSRMKNNLIWRHRVIKLIRDFMDEKGFIEVETPILTKSTPEGARDFLVPSRLQPGEFYALPQSPQQYKQLLMAAGLEKYFQIARCFRDEDLRGDRQPEFTQLDVEMSFVEQEDILNLIEELYIKIVQELISFDKKLAKTLTFRPFKRLTHQEAIRNYNTEQPDLRRDKKDPNELAFVWIVNWPLFKWNDEEKRYDPGHHIFTAPQEKDSALLDKEPLRVHSWQYDLVLNGQEIGGGSLRIYQREIQEKIFKLVGLNKKEIEEKFGHLLKAFDYGTPPHGGIALGIDRLLAILFNEPNIRQVMAFPKTGDGRDLMMTAPSPVKSEQLRELHIKVAK